MFLNLLMPQRGITCETSRRLVSHHAAQHHLPSKTLLLNLQYILQETLVTRFRGHPPLKSGNGPSSLSFIARGPQVNPAYDLVTLSHKERCRTSWRCLLFLSISRALSFSFFNLPFSEFRRLLYRFSCYFNNTQVILNQMASKSSIEGSDAQSESRENLNPDASHELLTLLRSINETLGKKPTHSTDSRDNPPGEQKLKEPLFRWYENTHPGQDWISLSVIWEFFSYSLIRFLRGTTS